MIKRDVVLCVAGWALVAAGCAGEDDRAPGDAGAATDAPAQVAPDASPRGDAAPPDVSEPTPQPPRDAGPPPPFEGAGEVWREPAPRATCASTDSADDTLSGLNGAVHCNLEIAGQVAAPHFLSLAWYDDCAYVNGADGTTVIHVNDAGDPSVTTTLTELGFRSNWETMKASPVSGLLAGYESNGSTLAVYDVSADCEAPVLQSSFRVGDLLGSLGHAGSFSPDGTIYYASSMFTSQVFAVDLAMPKAPTVITSNFERSAHDLYVGKDGTRGYFANPVLTALGTGAFAIMDLTDVQERKPMAQGTLIKEISWEDGNISQYPIAISYRGVDHLMLTDELGSGNCDNPEKPQWGYARIFDISDEQDPKLVALIKTEAQDPGNCQAAGEANGGTGGFGIGTHYCNVDRLDDPRLLACGNWDAGLRLYDIRNPWRPKEVGYFDTAQANVPGLARILPEKREIWLATVPGTFYVLRYAEGGPIDDVLSD